MKIFYPKTTTSAVFLTFSAKAAAQSPPTYSPSSSASAGSPTYSPTKGNNDTPWPTATGFTNSCTSIESITCVQTTSPPTVDAKISDWDGVEVFETPLTGALTSTIYGAGNIKIQCVYDTNNIYLLYQIPGKYMFDSSDNHKCAAVGNMFQVGEKASFFNMGNCPLSEAAGCDAVPGGCAPWAVDIAPQWELRRTERGTEYGPNTGNNGNHEFGITPYCRVDAPSNEWSAAWDFSGDATDGEKGDYIFEFSRPLTTSSPDMDIQLTAGTEVGFGVAFWDPNERAGGWSDSGHYVTGCSADWIGLRLVDENGDATPVFNGESSTTESNATNTDVNISPTYSPTFLIKPTKKPTRTKKPSSGSKTPASDAETAASGVNTSTSGASASVAGTAFTFIAAVVANFAVFEEIA